MSMQKHFLNNLWRWKCGLPENPKPASNPNIISDLQRTEWSPDFEQLMRNRLVFGAIRYGVMGHGEIPKGKPKYDRCESIRQRLLRYEKTGDANWLADIANMALLMFEERYHPKHHIGEFEDEEDLYHDKILKP